MQLICIRVAHIFWETYFSLPEAAQLRFKGTDALCRFSVSVFKTGDNFCGFLRALYTKPLLKKGKNLNPFPSFSEKGVYFKKKKISRKRNDFEPFPF